MKVCTAKTGALTALLIFALALTACGAASPGATTTPTTAAPTTTAPTTAPTTAAPTTTAPTTAPTTAAPTTTAPAGKLAFRYDFNQGDHGWSAGYSDFSKGMEDGIAFESGIMPLPEELKQHGKAYQLSSKNIADDVFMFMKRKLGKADGIEPNRTYQALIEISFATNAFAGSVGIGGSPAESVFVKVGGAPEEPKAVPQASQGNDYIGLNIDKGTQNGGGRHAVQIGNVAKTDGSEDDRYALKTLSNATEALTVTSDANGDLWIFFGTDSGFEGTTTLYYTSVNVTLE